MMTKEIPYVRIVADGYDAFFYLEDEASLEIVKMILERVTKNKFETIDDILTRMNEVLDE